MVKEVQAIETNAMKILANWPGAEEWFNKIPNELQHLIDIIRKRVNQDKDFVYCISAVEEGCIVGESSINTNRNTLGRRYTIRYMYNQFHKNPDKLKQFIQWNMSEPTLVRSYDGKRIRLHKIKDVVYSGRKEVWRMKLENGRKIEATRNHKIMTCRGWVELGDLNLKTDQVMCDSLNAKSAHRIRQKLYDVQLGKLYHHKYSNNGKKRIEIHRLIYEANINNMSLREYIDTITNEKLLSKKLKFLSPGFVIHHIDGNHYNNDIKNLEKLTQEEHLQKHSHEQYENFHQGVPLFSKILSIKFLGVKDTYDICCEEPHHNFVANGMVIHNSGKSTLGIIVGMLLDPDNFDLRNHVAYIASTDQIKSKFKIIPNKNQLLIDEGITSLHKHDWAMTDQKNLSRMLVTERWQNKVVAIAIPRLQDLPESVRNHKVKMNIKIMKRGLTVVHVRDDSDSGDPWWLVWAEKYQQKAWAGKHIADIDMGERLKVEKMKRTFLMSFQFPKLPLPLEKVYEQLKQEAHMEKETTDVKESAPEKKWKECCYRAIEHIKMTDTEIGVKKLAEIIGITYETLKKLVGEFDPEKKILDKKRIIQRELGSSNVPDYIKKMRERAAERIHLKA